MLCAIDECKNAAEENIKRGKNYKNETYGTRKGEMRIEWNERLFRILHADISIDFWVYFLRWQHKRDNFKMRLESCWWFCARHVALLCWKIYRSPYLLLATFFSLSKWQAIKRTKWTNIQANKYIFHKKTEYELQLYAGCAIQWMNLNEKFLYFCLEK